MRIGKQFTGTSTGKFILLGEHFVVPYHQEADLRVGLPTPALAFPMRHTRCEVTLTPSDRPLYQTSLFEEPGASEVQRLMAQATATVAQSLGLDLDRQPLAIRSAANFPISRGFGSSAAFAIALIRALCAYREALIGEPPLSENQLSAEVASIEQLCHGRPSGVDAAVILAGHPLRFENGKIAHKLSNRAVDFILVDSGARKRCADLIQKTSQFRTLHPHQWREMADTIRTSIHQCEQALENGEAEGVALCISRAHAILSQLQLSNPATDSLIDQARHLGALAGKISGAGGGGAVVLIARRGEGAQIAQLLKEKGHPIISVDAATETTSETGTGEDRNVQQL